MCVTIQISPTCQQPISQYQYSLFHPLHPTSFRSSWKSFGYCIFWYYPRQCHSSTNTVYFGTATTTTTNHVLMYTGAHASRHVYSDRSLLYLHHWSHAHTQASSTRVSQTVGDRRTVTMASVDRWFWWEIPSISRSLIKIRVATRERLSLSHDRRFTSTPERMKLSVCLPPTHFWPVMAWFLVTILKYDTFGVSALNTFLTSYDMFFGDHIWYRNRRCALLLEQ